MQDDFQIQVGYMMPSKENLRWSASKWHDAEEREERTIYSGLTWRDGGAGKVLIAVCKTWQAARLIVNTWNKVPSAKREDRVEAAGSLKDAVLAMPEAAGVVEAGR